MDKVLIAGCGRLGKNLGLKLSDSGYSVTGIKRQGTLPTPIHTINACLSSPHYINEYYDYIVYLASAGDYTKAAYQLAYVDGLKQLVGQLQKPPKRIIFASSTAVYGQHQGEWVDEYSPTEPQGFAGQALLEGERFLESLTVETTVVRFSGIYGPLHNRFLDDVLESKVKLSKMPSYSNRIHSEDCVRLLEFILKNPNAESLYLGTDSCPIEKNTLIHWIEDRLCLPRTQEVDHLPPRRGNKRCSNQKILQNDFVFKYPSFREGYSTIITASASI